MNIQTVNIDTVIPYWRNPRQVSDAGVTAVADSIERFGYQAPIIVDADMVVIAGHTRLQALRRLGWTEVDVVISDMSDNQAKEYRLVDNRTSEYGEWDNNKVFLELREFADEETARRFFPEINLSIDMNSATFVIDDVDMQRAASGLTNLTTGGGQKDTKTLTCPHCLEQFEISGK